MTSSRLPGKVLKKIKGVPLLKYHTDRLKRSGISVFAATTKNRSDDPVANFCESEGIQYCRGDEFDVLERYYQCVKKFNLDLVIRVTSDCPLIDGELIRKGVQNFQNLKDPHVYLANGLSNTFPRGFDFEIFGSNLLNEAHRNATESYEREHVTPYLYQGKNKRVRLIPVEHSENKSSYRVTVDTPEDLRLVEVLIEEHQAHLLNAGDIIRILDEHPELVAINAHIGQKKLGE